MTFMPVDRTGLMGLNHHCEGRMSAEISTLRQVVGGITTDSQGFLRPEPIGLKSALSAANFVDTQQKVLPYIDHIRPIWNLHSFTADGAMHAVDAEVWQEMASRGMTFIVCLFDGSVQRGNFEDRGEEAWQAGLKRRMLKSWELFMDFLDDYPDVADAIWAYEVANEPAGYDVLVDNTEATKPEAAGYYIDACLAVFDLVQARHPKTRWLIASHRYSADYKLTFNTELPQYGNLRGHEVLRDHMGAGIELRGSQHVVPAGWTTEAFRFDEDADIQNSIRDWTLSEIPVLRTELRVRNNSFMSVSVDEPGQMMSVLAADVVYYAGMGLWYWPFSNTSKGQMIKYGASGVNKIYRGSYAACVGAQSYPNNPEVFTGAQNGVKDETSSDAWSFEFTHFERAASADEGSDSFANDAPSPAVNRMTTIPGGAGTCVVSATDAQTNLLLGGDGWNVLQGGTSSWDILILGRGGGVVRTGVGGYNVVGVRHQIARIYAGAGWNKVVLYEGGKPFPDINAMDHANTVILDPAGTHYIHGLAMLDSHKVSFMGAFADTEALLAACTLVDVIGDNSKQPWDQELLVALPGGGEATFTRGPEVFAILADRCLDFTDGWYGDGWSEPADYDPAELDLIVDAATLKAEWDARYTLSGTASSNIFDSLGRSVSVSDHLGRVLQVVM
ncbi:MAG: hypothetical protein ABJO27_04975 [Pseudoruegeria sp.]